MATSTLPNSERIEFHLSDLPNVILGFFGIRTEVEVPYQSLLEDDAFSVRNYLPHSEIRNEEVGSRDQATNRSFSRLFNYIHGENWDGQKFAMTTPVIQRPSGEGRWTTSFFMKGASENLPLPKSSAVKLYAVTGATMAVLRFSGRPTEAAVTKQSARLRDWVRVRDLKVVGLAQVAQFDQPFSIPWFRRNEIHIPIETL